MRKFRKLLSLALALALCVCMLSGTVLAQDSAQDTTGDGVQDASGYAASVDADGSVTYYDTIGGAFTYANGLNTACTIRLCSDCETNTALEVSSGAEITLDLAGHSLCVSEGAKIRALKVSGTLNLADSGGESEKGTIYGGSATYGGSVYVDAGAVFAMSGGCISSGIATYGGNVYVCADGEFQLSGGSVSAGTATNGGGVYVKGSLSITNGEISSNTAKTSGGGVYLDKDSTFTLEGGRISDNQADFGAGVYDGRAEFTMTGGSITGNTAGTSGGGVRIYGWDSALAKFTMCGGEIAGNTAGTSGGGVYVSDGFVFYLSDAPVISGNTVAGGANNVYLTSGKTVTLAGELADGAKIGVTTATAPTGDVAVPVTSTEKATTYYKASMKYFSSDREYTTRLNGNGYVEICVDNIYENCVAKVMGGNLYEKYYDSLKDAFTYVEGQTTACTIILLMDCEADGTLTVDGKNVTLDLAGYTLTMNNSKISVSGKGTFTLTDSSGANSGTITDGTSGCISVSSSSFIMESGTICNCSGRAVSVDGSFTMTGGTIRDCSGGAVSVGGSFTMTGGMISDCSSSGAGGAVSISGSGFSSGSFTMTGGTIRNCSSGGMGGAVYVSHATFTMTGGTITGCRAANGGAVAVNKYNLTLDNGQTRTGTGSFTMTGGSISECTATACGGGVYIAGVSDCDAPGTFGMTGGEITECSAGSLGGGVYIMEGDTKITMSVSPFVSGNTVNGKPQNLYLSQGKTISVPKGFSSGASICVTTAVAATTLHPVKITEDIDDCPSAVQYVSADDSRYRVRDGGGYLEIYVEEYVAKVEDSRGSVSYFFNLKEAFTFANAQTYPCTVTLLMDCSVSSTLPVESGRNITLDLSGKKLKAEDGTSLRLFTVYGSLEIMDSTWSGKGTITGGQAENGGAIYVSGGSLTMTGGVIFGNTAEKLGGAVYVSGGTFTMTGGTISGNTAGNHGGGVAFDSGSTVNLSGSPVITSNTAGNAVDNLYLKTGQTITLAGKLTENARTGVYTEEEADDLDGIQVTGTETGTSYYRTAVSGITSDRRYGVRANANGYVEFYSTWFARVKDAGGNLTYYETVEAAFAYANTLSGACTVTLLGDYETFASLDTYSGRSITLDLAGYTLSAAVTMTNGSILKVHGNLTLTDSVGTGAITGCSKNGSGAGVYVYNTGTFTMKGGTISGNTAAYNGGGVYVSGGTFTMKGGTISGNTADASGGGVYLTAGSAFMISGAPVVTGNKSNYLTNNVYLRSGQQIILSGALTRGANVGVVTEVSPPTTGGSLQVTATEEDTDYYQNAARYLSSDRGWYMHANEGGYVELYRAATSAQAPLILTQPRDAVYELGDAAEALTVTASVTDGGTLSYQWYRSYQNTNSEGKKIYGATEPSYTPSTDYASVIYYYCVVTNTNNSVTREKTASTVSVAAAVTVNGGSGSGEGAGSGNAQGNGTGTGSGANNAAGHGKTETTGLSGSSQSEGRLVMQNTAETAENYWEAIEGAIEDSAATKTVIANTKTQEAAAESVAAEKNAASVEVGKAKTTSETSAGGESSKGGSAQKAKIYEVLEKVEEVVEDEERTRHIWLPLIGLLCILAGIIAEGIYFRYQKNKRGRKKPWRKREEVFQ